MWWLLFFSVPWIAALVIGLQHQGEVRHFAYIAAAPACWSAMLLAMIRITRLPSGEGDFGINHPRFWIIISTAGVGTAAFVHVWKRSKSLSVKGIDQFLTLNGLYFGLILFVLLLLLVRIY